MTKVTELSLYEKMSFLAYLQSSAHRVFHSAMNIMTCTNYTAKMKGIHSALFEWQLKNRHQPNFGPKNIYRSDSSVTSVTDRSDRSDSSVIRRLQKWQDRRSPAVWSLRRWIMGLKRSFWWPIKFYEVAIWCRRTYDLRLVPRWREAIKGGYLEILLGLRSIPRWKSKNNSNRDVWRENLH